MSEFQLLPATTGIRKMLEGNGFTLEDTGSTFWLKKDGITVMQVDAGPFSAPFVNALVAAAGIKSVTGLPLGFNQSDAHSKQGMLGNFSALFKHEFYEEGMTNFDLDSLALKVFSSDKIKKIEYDATHNAIKPIPAPLFKMSAAPILARDDFLTEDADAKPLVSFYEVDEEPRAFYVAVNMRRKTTIQPSIPKMWLDAIEREGLSYSYDDCKGILYVSNTYGAYYGFPPTARHMGLPQISLAIADWEGNAANVAFKESAGEGARSTANDAASTWTSLVDQFMDKPSRTTFAQLITSVVTKEFYDQNQKSEIYKMGTNKKTQTGMLRASMLGEQNAKSYEEFASEVKNTAFPKTNGHYLVLMMRMQGLIRVTTDGKVYFATQ